MFCLVSVITIALSFTIFVSGLSLTKQINYFVLKIISIIHLNLLFMYMFYLLVICISLTIFIENLKQVDLKAIFVQFSKQSATPASFHTLLNRPAKAHYQTRS